jgi:small GTP-binding protein
MSLSDAAEFKIVFIGATSVGKTCIVRRSTTGTFQPTVPTLGASYALKQLDTRGAHVRLLLWDTAGQERYRAITPMYYRGAAAAVLVYSVTDRESFAQIDIWLASLHKNVQNKVLIFVVGNKSDLEDLRDVDTAEGLEKASAIGAKFTEVSARTGDGVEELFASIAQTCIDEVETSVVQATGTPVQSETVRRDEDPCC